MSRLEDAAVISDETCGLRTHRLSLSDEFANVLETFGVRGLDEIGSRYRRSRPSERALARNSGEKRVALELYRRFRRHLFDLGVVSLDRGTQPLALPRLSAISAPRVGWACRSRGR